MECRQFQSELGRYLDGEVSADTREQIERHVADCGRCAEALRTLRAIIGSIPDDQDAIAPAHLWEAIEQRLHDAPSGRRRTWPAFARAAVVAFAIGLGALGVIWSDGDAARVSASSLSFAEMLDALQDDAQRAFSDFLIQYDAGECTPDAAKTAAADLQFETPAVLPGGFALQRVYLLRFGDGAAVAATYDRDGEFLGTLFHKPVQREDYGTHRDYPCVIGQHRGHKVQVGEWKLVHLTDPTTCHCVISRLDETSELPAVLTAVAPNQPTTAPDHHDH